MLFLHPPIQHTHLQSRGPWHGVCCCVFYLHIPPHFRLLPQQPHQPSQRSGHSGKRQPSHRSTQCLLVCGVQVKIVVVVPPLSFLSCLLSPISFIARFLFLPRPSPSLPSPPFLVSSTPPHPFPALPTPSSPLPFLLFPYSPLPLPCLSLPLPPVRPVPLFSSAQCVLYDLPWVC